MLYRPQSLGEAVGLLTSDPNARPLAGGVSLVAMLNARLIEPSALVSLARVAELHGIVTLANNALRIGAMTRHRQVAELSELIRPRAVLRQAAAAIANPTIRGMGTIGGSVALSDPAADYPAALVALSASIEIAGPSGSRCLAAADFFLDWYTTALAPGELVTAVHLPPPADGAGVYHKLARVAGDYAIVSVALTIETAGKIFAVIGACGPRPVWLETANAELARGNVAAAGDLLAAASDPLDDSRASASYRRRVIPRMLARAFAEAKALVRAL
jgi:aerobic carbon-monoxide dehydrogenase medium subunit